jgi:predicted metalloprotease
MQWRGRTPSAKVEDARREQPGRYRGGGGGGGLKLLFVIGRMFGVKGIVAVVIVGGVLWKMGLLDPGMITGNPSPGGPIPAEISPDDQERFEFVSVVLAGTEEVWSAEFERRGRRYVLPTMKVYRGQTATACGIGSAAMGPFYCPDDQTVYIDLGFYDELERTFHSPGDFAQAYVIAHEVGHHVQKLLGVSERVAEMRGRPDDNEFSVRLELQADFFAGVWAHHSRQYLDQGDIEEAMRAANSIGDDAIQKQTRGRVVPHAFTHGTSEQRMRWFEKGLKSGQMEDGDTFTMPYADL